MAIAQLVPLAPPQVLTYEQYLAEGVIRQKYDIIDGVRIVSSPNTRHQRISRKLLLLFAPYEAAMANGLSMASPRDVMIRRNPLRTRQPDVLYISNERFALNDPENESEGFDPAPEFVVEIISPSDTPAVLAEKIADYQSVNVREMWVARPALRTVEVLLLTPNSVQSVATYGIGETVPSIVFPGLSCAVAAIFAEP